MSLESPFSVLFNSEGTELAVTASQSASFTDGTQAGLLLMGSSSAGAQFMRLLNDGTVVVTGAITTTTGGAVAQGNSGSIAQSWYVSITDGTQVLGTGSSAPLYITGTVGLEPNSVVSVSGANFDTNGNLLVALSGVGVYNNHLQVTGTVSTIPLRCPNTTVTGYAASTTAVTVLPANSARCGATFFMDGNSRAFLKLGAAATTSDFSVQLRNHGYYELPANYTGIVSVVFNNSNSSNILRITEITD